jgi:hypothetical protein
MNQTVSLEIERVLFNNEYKPFVQMRWTNGVDISAQELIDTSEEIEC